MRWPFGRKKQDSSPEPVQEPEEALESPEEETPDELAIEASPEPEELAPVPDLGEPDEAIEELEESAEEPEAPTEEPAPKQGWFARLRQGLSKSSSRISSGVSAIFTRRTLDDETLEELEDLLIGADLGVSVAVRITANLSKSRFGKEVTDEEIKQALAEEVAQILEPVSRSLEIEHRTTPQALLFVGVNGSGKTTTIGKIAQSQGQAGRSLMLAAGDTFRAAAVEQLKIWGERTGAPVVTRPEGADPAGLAFDALKAAQEAQTDLLLIDTAGRLHNRQELMDELAKVVRVLKKLDETAPHQVILVLDATIGQNALAQVKAFKDMVDVTGLIVTKLDGTAKGGVVVALAEEFGLPIHAVGVGEGAEDLRDFDPHIFAHALVGLPSPTET